VEIGNVFSLWFRVMLVAPTATEDGTAKTAESANRLSEIGNTSIRTKEKDYCLSLFAFLPGDYPSSLL
jgi:hypothetical protein